MQTATENFDPRTVRAGLERLKAGVSSAAATERGLMKAKAERLSALRREAQHHAEQDAQKLEIRIHTLNDRYKQQLAQAQAAMELRLARIQQAYHSSKSSLARRIQESKDRRIGKVQGAIMRKRQERQQELEQAGERHRVFQEELLADRGTRRDLRKRVLCACRTFRPWIDGWFDGRRGKFPAEEAPEGAEDTRKVLLARLDEAGGIADEAARLPLPKVFRFIPLWLLASVILVIHVWYGLRAGGGGLRMVLPSLLIAEGVLCVLWLAALASSWSVVKRAASALASARFLETSALNQSTARLEKMNAEIKSEQAEEGRNLSETFRESDDEWRARMAEGQRKLEERYARLPAALERLHQRKLAKLQAAHEDAIHCARQDADERLRSFEAGQNIIKSSIDAETEASLVSLEDAWKTSVLSAFGDLSSLTDSSLERFPPWSAHACETWKPPAQAPSAVRIGMIEVDAAKLADGMPGDHRLALPDGGRVSAPFALAFPDQGSLLIESDGSDDGASTRALQAAALRLLASHPPGRASFVFIDPVGLGKDFAGLMHLADYEETLISHRIWTQNTHIEERLAEVNDHIEKVIQMYLRDEYANLSEYNEQAGTIAEKYRFVVIAGFPAAFSDTAMKRLRSIASSGARCGVHLLIERDLRQPAPETALEDELRHNCLRLVSRGGGFHLAGAPAGADVVVFDAPPTHQDSITLVHRIGKASVDSNRVQVPFSQIAPSVEEYWQTDTSEELRVPVGRTGAKKLQMLAIGKGTRQHVLVAGKTGSGKSTLFHVIITNLARWCSPDQVEFYLVDFKKGVEFKCYAAKHLPHARVVAIESDREFALSVLQRVDAELKRRGELFRKAGAQDVAGYKRTPGSGPMPRTLLLIDEFQEFFTEDDAVAQEASLLLDRIVRQGRAFGIHVILGSQTLGGAYTLARATLGQMVIRIALQCNEADAHLIMDDDNPAPRLLTRPGEGIYNDQAGALAANSPFQIVWLPEDERDAVLDEVTARAAKVTQLPVAPIIFEGNAPAEVRDNPELATALRGMPSARPRAARAWLGAPNSIKGPTEAVFQRQSGSHLLVVGQSAERSLSMLAITMVSIAAQYPVGEVEFVVLDPHASEAAADGIFQQLAAILPQRVRVGGPAEAGELMSGLGADLAARTPTSGRDAPEVFLLVHDLQRFKALRPEDDFKFSMDDEPAAVSPSKAFSDLLGEGGPCGMHVIVSTDTWNNVSRWIPRKLMAEFEMRVLFQMSANDSANLIDSPAATTLGLHRALFHNEHLGTLETFRPYAMPDSVWLEELAAQVRK
jgi:DNA segregation ATPase FtsK/SpoIIIE, S-DNA-T family